MIKDLWVPDQLKIAFPTPKNKLGLGSYIRQLDAFAISAEAKGELLSRVSRSILLESALYGQIFWGDKRKEPEWLGLLGNKVITDVGVAFLVDAWQNIVELEIMKHHSLGTGSTAENQTDTALVTELTTEYTGNVRAVGSLTEGATANVFRTVGTNTLDGTPGAALREHGIHSATTGGTLWDRTVYAAITLSSGDAFQTTYDMTASANG